jgi:hypothetical protein
LFGASSIIGRSRRSRGMGVVVNCYQSFVLVLKTSQSQLLVEQSVNPQ